MSYQTITTVITDIQKGAAATDAAIALADQFNAHLDICALGIDGTEPGFYYAGGEALLLAESLKAAREVTALIKVWTEDRMRKEITPWSLATGTVQHGGIGDFLARRLRFTDLVVLPKPYGQSRDADDVHIVEAALFRAERPVLLLPENGKMPKPGGRITFGWNDGAEALSAARAALPFLKAAAQVDICIIDPPRHGEDRSDPGGALSQYLVRHGVRCQVAVMARTEASIGHILTKQAEESGSELIVSGAYGHSRLRQAMFGGTTRSLLSDGTVPLLMSR